MIGKIVASWRLRRASRRYDAGDFEGALAAVRGAMEADPGLPLASQYLGVITLKRGRLDEAADHLRRASAEDADPFVLFQARGALAMLRKRWREAEEDFRRALEAFPVAFELGYPIGLARLMAGDEKGAFAEFVRLLSREDDPLFKRLKRLDR